MISYNLLIIIMLLIVICRILHTKFSMDFTSFSAKRGVEKSDEHLQSNKLYAQVLNEREISTPSKTEINLQALLRTNNELFDAVSVLRGSHEPLVKVEEYADKYDEGKAKLQFLRLEMSHNLSIAMLEEQRQYIATLLGFSYETLCLYNENRNNTGLEYQLATLLTTARLISFDPLEENIQYLDCSELAAMIAKPSFVQAIEESRIVDSENKRSL